MAYDGIYFKSLIKEFNEELLNKRLEKINQHSDEIVTFTFSRLKDRRLHISISAEKAFIALNKDKLPNPNSAPMFCMLLRKHLSNAILKSIEQIRGDRIISLEFETLNEMKDIEKKYVFIEIMGRHSNLILCSEEMNVIDSLKHVNPLMSKRPMGPGYKYEAPFEEKIRLEKINEELLDEVFEKIKKDNSSLKKSLITNFAGFSSDIAEKILFESNIENNANFFDIDDKQLEKLKTNLIMLENEIAKSEKPFFYYNKKKELQISSINLSQFNCTEYNQENYPYSELVCEHFNSTGKNDIVLQKTKTLSALIKQMLSKEEKRIANLEKDIKKAENFEKYRLYGELCTANIHLLKKGMEKASVLNYYDNTELELPLKYNKNPQENAENFFKRYQKMKTTLVQASEQIKITKEKIEHFEDVINSLELADNLSDYESIKEELVLEGILKEKKSKQKQKKEKKLAPREFKSPNGFLVKVGRNNIQNDELSLKISKKEDIWLHTKEIPSSHTVLCAKFEDVEEEDILFAASVCAKFSKAKDSENVPVDFTEIKNVSKPKGAKPGKVIYVKYKTVYVNPLNNYDKNLNLLEENKK